MDAGTVAEADELDTAEPTDNVVVDWVTGKVVLDEAAALESGVIVGGSVEDDGLEITVGSSDGVDVGVAAGGIRLGVELGAVEDAVVGGRTEVDVLDVEGMPTGGEFGIMGALVEDDFTAGGAVEESGASPGGVSPAKALEVSV